MITIDARGHRCPVPTLKLRKALETAKPGDRLTLLADDPMARIDVPHFVSQVGAKLLGQNQEATTLTFLVEKV